METEFVSLKKSGSVCNVTIFSLHFPTMRFGRKEDRTETRGRSVAPFAGESLLYILLFVPQGQEQREQHYV